MKHSLALQLAEHLARAMRPHCVADSVRIVGSVRRGKPEVKDIELLVLPRWEEDESAEDLFGERPRLNALHVWATSERTGQVIRWVKGGRGKLERGVETLESTTPNPEGSYWRGYLPEHHLMLDLFLATAANYGGLEIVRTGPAEFSEAILAHAKRIGKKFYGGVLYAGAGALVPTPREEDVFAALGLRYLEPGERVGYGSLRAR